MTAPARWPATMRRKVAAEYLDMSEAAFEREVASGRLPPSFMFGGQSHWSKDAIDAAIAMLHGGRTNHWEQEFWNRGKAA